jgi:hypothetical protein
MLGDTMTNNSDNKNSLPKLRPGVRWNPPKPATEPHPFEDLPDGDFDPTDEDREAARLASDIGPEILPFD